MDLSKEERTLRCKEIKKLHLNNGLGNVAPLWHLDKSDIDFGKQNEQLDTDLMAQGYTILNNINIEALINSLQAPWHDLYRKKYLFHTKHWDDWKICEIIYNWSNHNKLIPPSICFNELLTDKTFPADGKHRINVAYYFGATEIPIIIPNKHSLEVSKLILGK